MKRMALYSVVVATFLIVCGAPSAARAGEPEPIHRYSDNRLPPPSTRLNLFLTGTAMFAVAYGGAVGASYMWPDTHGARELRIPFVGPWLMVGRTHLCKDDPQVVDCQDPARIIGAIFAAIDGLAQGSSLFFFAESAFMSTAPLTTTSYNSPRTHLLRLPSGYSWDTRSRRAWLSSGDFALYGAPYSDARIDAGFSIFGSF